MRFLHTADWHLGRLFHQVHLTEDQFRVLGMLSRQRRVAVSGGAGTGKRMTHGGSR